MSDSSTGSTVYRFLRREKKVIQALTTAVRGLLRRPDILPWHVSCCGVLLHALQRLPRVTPAVELSVCLIRPDEFERFWVALTIDAERVEFEKGRTVFGDAGSDNESQSEFLVCTDSRADENRFNTALGWVETFQWLAEADGIEIKFEDFGDSPPDWDDDYDSDERWNELPPKWEEEE